MASILSSKLHCIALGATFAVVAATSFAQAPVQQASAPEPVVLAQAAGTATAARTEVPGNTADAHPPLQAGVRLAATQGPEALRRYIHRTRMIYAWYYPDFAVTN